MSRSDPGLRKLGESFEGIKKEWPPLKECAPYKYNLIDDYVEKGYWDDLVTSDKPIYYYEDMSGVIHQYTYNPADAKRFLQIIRSSRGYDLDMPPPGVFTHCILRPVKNISICQRHLDGAKDHLIKHIHSKTGKVYEYVETLKVVDCDIRIFLLTFTAKEDNGADDAPLETFLATVAYYNGYIVLECFLKPDYPASTEV